VPGIVEADRGEAMRAIMIAVATAWLATAQPAAAKDVCNTLATPLTSAEIAELRNEAVRLMPLRYDEAARAVTIENASDNKGDIAPAAHANGHGGVSIVVPTRFRVLLCQLFLVHIYYLNGFHSPSELKTRMNECVTTRSASDCIFIVTSKIVGGRRAFDFSNDPSPFLKVTDEALFTILLHEYAHVVLKDFESIGPASETNADAFSLVYSLLGMKGDLGAVGAFYGLTFADAFFSESIHGSFACRAYIGNQIMSRLSNKISKIHAWGLLTLAKYRADQANPGPKEDVFGPVGETRLRELKCRGYDPRFVDQIEQDVDSILTVVDRPVSGQPEPFAYYDPEPHAGNRCRAIPPPMASRRSSPQLQCRLSPD
jgi:hypothetical protein